MHFTDSQRISNFLKAQDLRVTNRVGENCVLGLK